MCLTLIYEGFLLRRPSDSSSNYSDVPEDEKWPCEILSKGEEVGHAVHPSPANVIKENNHRHDGAVLAVICVGQLSVPAA